MAIAKFGVIVAGVRGTIGGSTFSANKAGPYLKSWAKGGDQRSTLQTVQRNRIARWAQGWQGITGAQRTDWDTYAALPAQELTNSLGDPYYVSGFAWYVNLNTALQAAGAGPISAAPVLATPGTSIINSFNVRSTASGLGCFIDFNGGDPTLTMNKAIFISLANSLGRAVRPTRPRFIKIGVPAGPRFVIFTTEINTIFGTLQIGQKAFAFIYAQNSEGRRGPVLAATTEITT